MPKVITYQCDLCDKVKKATNRWWIVRFVGSECIISPFTESCSNDGVYTLCGEEHVVKKISEYLASHKNL